MSTDPTRDALREAAEQAFHWFVMSAGEYHAHYGHNDEPIDDLRAALATSDPTPMDDRLRFHPVTGDPDFEQAPLSHRLDVLADLYRSEGMRLATPDPAPAEDCGHGRSAHGPNGCRDCGCKVTYDGGRATPDPAPDVEAAWEALINETTLDNWEDPAEVIARHRPIIEAAIRAETIR